MPAHLQVGMHDREVVEWLQTDTNLVGCIERKARVLKARSYEEALTRLTAAEAAGEEWHFCRGVLNCETGMFKTYEEVNAGGWGSLAGGQAREGGDACFHPWT